jgi:RNA polymerase sigma factor (sigma-70 family)
VQAITAAGAGTIERSVDDFERLFRAEYPRVVAVAARVLGDAGEAEDVAQDVFSDFHRLHDARAPWAAGWLHRAAAHRALNAIRTRDRRGRRETAAARERQLPPDPADEAVRAEERRTVRAALARLPEKSAAVLALRYGGLSYAEVAAALGVGVNSVGTILKRAEAKLRQEVERGTSG